MKKVITYGSYDLFHNGHYRLLERAKKLGGYLIVGVTTEYYDNSRGKLNVVDSLMTRIESVKKTGFADEIIIEDHDGQKLEDIIKYGIDIFTVGSDWTGTFDFLKEYCDVIYLERTKMVSSTMLREQKFPIIKLGMIGTGRVAVRFPEELKYVSGIELTSVYNPRIDSAKKYAAQFELGLATDNKDEFYESIDAVNIASPHETHIDYIMEALERGKHVLCEKPMCLKEADAIKAFELAKAKRLILMEGIKTAYAPGFVQLIGVARSGVIGNIRDVEAGFTKLIPHQTRELTDFDHGGSFTELASYTLLPILKLMGCNYEKVSFESLKQDDGIDIYTKAYFYYKNALGTAKTGLGIKSEGQLLISGTKGYILAKSPWWLTKGFEICFEDTSKNEFIATKFLGEGFRYEISDFVKMIRGSLNGYEERLTVEESVAMAKLMEKFLSQRKKPLTFDVIT
nr:Gfo/Idh/MocA family oxidoreductase [uncultured Desulfobacter sp.]